MQTAIATVSNWLLPLLVAGILVAGYIKRVPLYHSFVDGAKGGFGIAIRLLPHLVAMMVAVEVFRASGAMDLLVQSLTPVTSVLHIPPEVLPIGLLRPISSSASLAFMTHIFQDPKAGPDSWLGQLASTLQASSDTTLYIITVYFGSVGIRNFRYALKVGLLADVASVFASVLAVTLLLGPMP
ncbi:spore maturation protein [Alicyclobacillus shizuokensis]|uniref:spore maturation protein n=1 Tax=Alicyclobacillus shizuokensis TaxID=392014 RepID=UPI00082EEFEB|nr:nucleoside recognition domain-containing protein [Alicyclobacillus shizuokensis]MCL6626222.1 spore maturation protein [Alicyclobacillus shizuokensis]